MIPESNVVSWNLMFVGLFSNRKLWLGSMYSMLEFRISECIIELGGPTRWWSNAIRG